MKKGALRSNRKNIDNSRKRKNLIKIVRDVQFNLIAVKWHRELISSLFDHLFYSLLIEMTPIRWKLKLYMANRSHSNRVCYYFPFYV